MSFPAYCFASSSIIGWIIRQGPHHGAQNSTRTAESDSRTRDCQFASVIGATVIYNNRNYFIPISISINQAKLSIAIFSNMQKFLLEWTETGCIVSIRIWLHCSDTVLKWRTWKPDKKKSTDRPIENTSRNKTI